MSGANSQGWMRDSEYFFKNLQNQSPQIFSKQNTKVINNGLAPEVDSTFIKYFPQYKDYMEQELKHHHIGGEGQAMPIPAELHQGSGGIHNIEKSLGIFGDEGVDEANVEMLRYIKNNTRRTRLWKRK